MEELGSSGLLAYYSDKGRTGSNPTMLHAIVTYIDIRGVRAVNRVVGLCQRDFVFIWLTKGQEFQRSVFYGSKGKKLTGEILDGLNYQFMRRLEKRDLISLREPYTDGTKIKTGANRCASIWWGSLNYHLADLLDTIDALYAKYNTFLLENGYGPKYSLGNAWMSVIEGVGRVRKAIEEDRKRKLTRHKEISNSTTIGTDYCSPSEIRKLQKSLMRIAQGEDIRFVYRKGKYKPRIQKFYEELEEYGIRLMGHKECFEIIGRSRSSYSRTDMEVTFARVKGDHMLSGWLKPAYNVQITVKNYLIVHGYVNNDRADYHTLILALERYEKTFGNALEAVTADSGYCSEKDLLYLEENGIRSYIKLRECEKRKTRTYKEDTGEYYTMTYAIFEDERYYIRHGGRELRYIRTESKEQDGYTQAVEVYGYADCSGCEHKSKRLYKYSTEKNLDRNKAMKINERWEEPWEESHTNIQSEGGVLEYQICSIQVKEHSGDIKENENFRRFNHQSEEKVYKEFMLYEIGRNMTKYHQLLHREIEKYEGKEEQKAAQQTERSVKTKQGDFAP